jgi:hypothetical protein
LPTARSGYSLVAIEAVTMEMDFDDTAARTRKDYVQQVSAAMGLRCACACVLTEQPVSVYLAVEGRVPRYPDRDVALLWDEQTGWSAAVETYSGEDLIVVADLESGIWPAPQLVADWAIELLSGGQERRLSTRTATSSRTGSAVTKVEMTFSQTSSAGATVSAAVSRAKPSSIPAVRRSTSPSV